MAQTTMAGVRGTRRFHQRVLLVLTAVLVLGSLHTAGPAFAAETGIRGTVLIGPIRPGPDRVGETNEAPLQASFTVYEAARQVLVFKSDSKGMFEVSLPAGVYTIVPHKGTPVPAPDRQRTQVTVPNDGFASITIRLNSGML